MYLSEDMTDNVTNEPPVKNNDTSKHRKLIQQFGTPAASVAKPNV
jgi:hypothetical protein